VGSSWRSDEPRELLFEILKSREAILGWTEDLLIARGPLFNRRAWMNKGRLQVDLASEPVAGYREIAVATPSLAAIQKEIGNPEELLLYMMEQRFCESGSGEERDPPPFIVHGSTFLELREAIGRALYQSRSDYAGWAAESVAAEVEQELRELLRIWPMESRPHDIDADHLRRALLEKAADPQGGRPQLRLAGWLGDVRAWDVVRAVELRMINRLLGAGIGESSDEDRLDIAESSWSRLGGWFPPAVRTRIVTPLLPAYDAERDLVGFYRFILPSPRAHGRQPSPIPRLPHALQAVRLLLEREEVADALVGGARAFELRYDDGKRRLARRSDCPPGIEWPRRVVRVEISLAGPLVEESGSPLYLVAYFPADVPGSDGGAAPAAPLCMRFESGRREAAGAGLAGRLNSALDAPVSPDR
jgi:hypothetical protein